MLESPVSPGAPPGHASSSLPPPTYSVKEAHKFLSPSPARLLPSFRRCGNPSPAINSRRPAPPPRPSIRVNDRGSGQVPAVDSPRSGSVSAVDSRRLASGPRRSICIDDLGSGRVSGIESRLSAPPPRPIDDPGLGRFPLRAIDPRRLEPRSPSSTPVDDPQPGPSLAMDSRPSGPGPRPSYWVLDSGPGHVSAIDSRPAPRSRPVDDPGLGRLPLRAIDPRGLEPRFRPSTRAMDSRPSGPGPRRSIRVLDSVSGHVSAIESRPTPPPRLVDDPESGLLPLPAIHSRSPTPRPGPSIHVHGPGSGRVRDMNLPRSAPQPRPLIRVDGPGSGRVQAVNSRRPAARPRPLIQVDSHGGLGSCKPSAVPNKELEEAESEIQRLTELHLGENIGYEEYSGYLYQLPGKPAVDTSTKMNDVQLKELNSRHALYRIKYQLSQQVHGGCLEEDWSFHPDYCKLAGLEDYQRLVPRNYGGYEYAGWDEYSKDFHSYEIEQEYIKYCEDLSTKLKWMEAYVPNKYPSLKWGMILTRGTYQAIKIATDFSKITGGLAFKGFYEWLDSMIFDVYFYNEFDGVYYEIWQRYTNETKFRDVLYEVYELNRFPLRQDRMRCALENDTFCSDLEEEFLACTTCLKEFIEDKAQVTEEKARELIAEALRNEKPKSYKDYCRKKIDIARAIGLISS